MRVDLPNGQWAEIADAKELTNSETKRLRRLGAKINVLRAKMAEHGLQSPEEMTPEIEAELAEKWNALFDAEESISEFIDPIDEIQSGMVMVCLREWSFGPTPTTVQEFDDAIPFVCNTPLVTAVLAEWSKASPDLSPDGAMTEDGKYDHASPTQPSDVLQIVSEDGSVTPNTVTTQP